MKNQDLLTASYDYELPSELIAERALDKRDESRLLIYNEATDEVIHTQFKHIAQYLGPDHHLVLNQSKVFPCRFYAHKKTGGKVEVFILSLIPINGMYEVMLRSSGKKNISDEYICEDLVFTLSEIKDDKFYIKLNLSHDEFIKKLDALGNIPIPPYIRDGIADAKDKEQYQTVYAKKLGSVAAPTAGLHFTNAVFDSLQEKGIEKSFVTLHVGVGTFKPVKDDNILEHKMHSEIFEIEPNELKKINSHKDHLIAVGTTSLRVLESLWERDHFKETQSDDTDIFLYPGVPVASIQGLITNFHLPKSTLIMLVSSLIGREKTLELYQVAVSEKYRFFSYGDSMLILRDPKKVIEHRESKA
jgi:S-adenosylmethionine:tRNA ribosyltransferase-isomerase